MWIKDRIKCSRWGKWQEDCSECVPNRSSRATLVCDVVVSMVSLLQNFKNAASVNKIHLFLAFQFWVLRSVKRVNGVFPLQNLLVLFFSFKCLQDSEAHESLKKKRKTGPGVMAQACNPSALGGRGGWIAWAWELETQGTSLGNLVKSRLYWKHTN